MLLGGPLLCWRPHVAPCPRDASIVARSPCAIVSGADLQSALQLPIPCYLSTSYITDNHYLSHHPMLPSRARRVPPATKSRMSCSSCNTVRSNPTRFQSPTLRAASVSTRLHLLYTHMSLYNALLPKTFLQQSKLCDKISSSAKNAQIDIVERHHHLAPPPLRVAGARPRSPHISLRRFFSSHPQPRFRQTVGLGASYITVSRSFTKKTNDFAGPLSQQARYHHHARQQVTGPANSP